MCAHALDQAYPGAFPDLAQCYRCVQDCSMQASTSIRCRDGVHARWRPSPGATVVLERISNGLTTGSSARPRSGPVADRIGGIAALLVVLGARARRAIAAGMVEPASRILRRYPADDAPHRVVDRLDGAGCLGADGSLDLGATLLRGR